MRYLASFLLVLASVGAAKAADGTEWLSISPSGLEAGETRQLLFTLSQAIEALNPTVPQERAVQLATLLLRWSPDPLISVGIIMQESAFKDGHSGEWEILKTGQPVFRLRDATVTQINWASATYYGCDLNKLLREDLDEALRCHGVILKRKLVECKPLGREAFGCYHSQTARLRKKYVRAVLQHMRKAGLYEDWMESTK